MEQVPFFSFVIPAHNEEGYIVDTLACLSALEYPKEQYEVIVVENGSSDETLLRAKQSAGPNVQVISVPGKGVSNARNQGIERVRATADWILFLDADTRINPSFLREVTIFLSAQSAVPYVLGTAALGPWPATFWMNFWYTLANLGTWMRGSSYAGLLLVKRELVMSKTIRFDETMHVGEDLRFAAEVKKHGKGFFLWTKNACTSTRRYANGEWAKFPLWVGVWLFAMIVPIHVQRRFKYKVVR